MCAPNSESFFLIARQMLETWTTDKNSYHIEKINFSVKWLQITRSWKKCRELDSFNITSQFAVALNTKFHVIHILKKYNFYHPNFFSLIYIFCVAMTNKNHK